MTFQEIVGHKKEIEHLQNAISMGKVSHAYIFDGEKGIGKKMLADTFAAALQCEKQGIEPCMECASCHQAVSGNHPDIIHVAHEKPATISVDDIRDQVCNDILIMPYKGPWKIYLIEEAEKMNVSAQNAILKTIEEPPAYGVIILETENAASFLPTILSRCVVLHLKPAPDKKVKEYLMSNMKIPDYEADICVAFAQGNVGKAVRLATSEDFTLMKDHMIHLVKYIQEMSTSELVASMKRIVDFKADIGDYLDLLMVWYRDVLVFKAIQNPSKLVFSDEAATIREMASKSSYEGLEIILESITKAKVRLKANVNFDLTMELMLLTMKEN